MVDVTHATDAPGVDVNELGAHPFGSGPVIERGSNLNPRVVELLYETAEAEAIPFTVQASARYTGTDVDAMHFSRGGIPCGGIGLPLRYMHSPVEMVQLDDVANAARAHRRGRAAPDRGDELRAVSGSRRRARRRRPGARRLRRQATSRRPATADRRRGARRRPARPRRARRRADRRASSPASTSSSPSPGARRRAALLARIRRGEAAGVIFLGANLGTPAQVRALTRALRRVPQPRRRCGRRCC